MVFCDYHPRFFALVQSLRCVATDTNRLVRRRRCGGRLDRRHRRTRGLGDLRDHPECYGAGNSMAVAGNAGPGGANRFRSVALP